MGVKNYKTMRYRGFTRIAIMLLLLLFSVTDAVAERIVVRAGAHADYGRMVFKWSLPVGYSALIENGELRLNFQEPAEADFGELRRNLRNFITGVNVSNGGRDLRLPLRNPDYQLRSFYTGSFLVVDILGQPETPQARPTPQSVQPSAPPAVSSAPSRVPEGGPTIRVRKGEHSTYTRIVFDWDKRVPYEIGDFEGQTIVSFNEPARYNLAPARRNMNGQVRAIRQNGNDVVLNVTSGSRIQHSYVGTKVVVDVYRDQLARKAAPPGQETPLVAASEPAPQPAPAQPLARAAPPPDPAPAPVVQAAPTPAPDPDPEPAPAPVVAEQPPVPAAAPVAEVSDPIPVPAAQTADRGPNEAGLAGAFSLRFEFGEPVAAAAYRRGGAVWLVFDKQSEQNVEALRQRAQGGILNIEQLDIPRATVLRIETVEGFNPRPKREGLSWIFEFGKIPLLALNEVPIEAQPFSPAGARLFVPVQEGGLPVPVNDPVIGDNLMVVPVIPLGHGVNTARRYPQFEVLASAQGVVYKPLSDDLRVRTLTSGLELTSSSGLKLSETGQKEVAEAKVGGLRGISRVFDFDKWKVSDFDDYRETRQQMEQALIGLKGPRKDIARTNLARFYAAHAMGPEALGVIRVLGDTDKQKLQDPEFIALRGVANFALNRYQEALADFENEALRQKDEGAFWYAATNAALGNLEEEAVNLKRLAGVIRPYPPRLKVPLGLLLTEAALEVGDVRQAEAYLEVLESEGLGGRQGDAVKYLRGLAKEVGGDPDGAILTYEEVALGEHRPSRARAVLSRAELLFKQDEIDRDALIEELEKLRFAWRGDDFEFNLLRRLGDVYVENGNFRDGLRTLRQAATYFREHPQSEDVTQEMIRIFEELYLAGKADELPPVTAIALYDEFRELTPSGDKGDEMIRKLADRLAAVDLLREAAELLENQVQFRLSGLKKAQVGTRLAVVYLAAGNPGRAIRTLKRSNDPALSEEEVAQRRHLEARALMDQGKPDAALLLLEEDESVEAETLRSEIYWAGADWRNASRAIRQVAAASGVRRNAALDEDQARLVLNLAVAYTLGNNERGIAQVRNDYGGAMEQTSLRDAFRLIAARENAGILDPRTITQLVQPAENFTSFMSEYQERLKAGELSAIN